MFYSVYFPFKDSAHVTGSTFRLLHWFLQALHCGWPKERQILCCPVRKLKSSSISFTINTADPLFIPQQLIYGRNKICWTQTHKSDGFKKGAMKASGRLNLKKLSSVHFRSFQHIDPHVPQNRADSFLCRKFSTGWAISVIWGIRPGCSLISEAHHLCMADELDENKQAG